MVETVNRMRCSGYVRARVSELNEVLCVWVSLRWGVGSRCRRIGCVWVSLGYSGMSGRDGESGESVVRWGVLECQVGICSYKKTELMSPEICSSSHFSNGFSTYIFTMSDNLLQNLTASLAKEKSRLPLASLYDEFDDSQAGYDSDDEFYWVGGPDLQDPTPFSPASGYYDIRSPSERIWADESDSESEDELQSG